MAYRKYSVPATELIQKRVSVRTYVRRLLPAESVARVEDYLSQASGPFGGAVRMQFLESSGAKGAVRLGAYGTITGARSFICAISDMGASSLLQVGYMMEDVVLYLTSLGFGTCWMAGTFSQSKFRRAADVASDEILPIVTAVGYPSAIRNPVDLLIKPTPGFRRLPWARLFFAEDMERPLSRELAGDYRMPLEMVRLSPSASNKQPWRVVRRGGKHHFYLAHDRTYARRHPYDIQRVDMGIALYHFQTTALEAGLDGSWVESDPGIAHLPSACEYPSSGLPAMG